MIMELTSITGLKGEVSIPGDKSISHRSVMFASLANGMTEIHNFLSGADCLATIDCFRKMGIKIEEHQNRILVHGTKFCFFSCSLPILVNATGVLFVARVEMTSTSCRFITRRLSCSCACAQTPSAAVRRQTAIACLFICNCFV